MRLSGRKILLGVTGSIAAYKAVLVLRRLVAEGAAVTVVMTEAAQRFVGPLTFQALSGKPVYHDPFDTRTEIVHLTLAKEADLILVAPATADFLARVANGFGDQLLSAIMLAAEGPVVLAPAMDAVMWENRFVQSNLKRLIQAGMGVVQPEEGLLASGVVGPGRLASEDRIVEAVERALVSAPDFGGEVVLVTAGPTREPIDPVRYISNRSSGKMGYALARAARRRGARVILISGPGALPDPPGVETIRVETARDMSAAVSKYLGESTVLIMAAAVADWRPAEPATRKAKKTGSPLSIEFIPTADILEQLPGGRESRVVVGFSAETEDLEANAREKLRRKRLDLIVANDVTRAGAGFEGDTNIVTLIDAGGGTEGLPLMSKDEVAERILDRIRAIKRERPGGGSD